MYLCKFDGAGKRTTTVVDGVHFSTDEEKQKYLDDGYVETSDDDYAYYIGNRGTGANGTGYVRGADGKPTDAPAHTPSADEKNAALDADYNQQKQDLINEYADARIHGDTDTIALVQQEMAALDEWYDEEYRKIEEETEDE